MPLGAVRRAAVLAHFDPHGHVAPHVRRAVDALAAVTDRLVVVSTASLTEASRRWLDSRAEPVTRPNIGHDFASYRTGLARLGTNWDEVVLANDSAVFPLVPLGSVLREMSAHGADFWGITPGYGWGEHVQSYFMSFRVSVIGSPYWSAFWNAPEPSGSREEIILTGEVGLSRILVDSGFSMTTLLRPSARERLVGAARADSKDLQEALRSRNPRRVAGWSRRMTAHARRAEWNPAVALADVSLREPERLPAVKISAIRDDAYGLGTRSLLDALEARYPVAFDGVRAYLERTDEFYGNRWALAGADPGALRYRSR